mmetsp:Transcript_8402/g.21417  ORF Transcript_8402/g.21417 Transcript_8402/m.21417 type:complete len:312 (-) Transcript_8402:1122-2057(-)
MITSGRLPRTTRRGIGAKVVECRVILLSAPALERRECAARRTRRIVSTSVSGTAVRHCWISMILLGRCLTVSPGWESSTTLSFSSRRITDTILGSTNCSSARVSPMKRTFDSRCSLQGRVLRRPVCGGTPQTTLTSLPRSLTLPGHPLLCQAHWMARAFPWHCPPAPRPLPHGGTIASQNSTSLTTPGGHSVYSTHRLVRLQRRSTGGAAARPRCSTRLTIRSRCTTWRTSRWGGQSSESSCRWRRRWAAAMASRAGRQGTLTFRRARTRCRATTQGHELRWTRPCWTHELTNRVPLPHHTTVHNSQNSLY